MTELERSLVALGRELDVPEAPELVTAVLAAIAPRREAARPRPRRRRLVLALAVLLVAALGATLAIPDARSAFLRIFDIGGERIEIVEDLPEIPVGHDVGLTLGQEVTLEEAKRRSDVRLRGLASEPDHVYLGDRGTVWFLYGTPESPRLLLSQTPTLGIDEPALAKKLADEETRVEFVTVNGARGVFLSGEPHFLFLLDESGDAVEESVRLAENVLLWDAGGIAYRLEGDFDREGALRLADTLRPGN